MRTFISIDIPEEIKKKIKEIQDKLPEFYGKKTEQENLHLTLKFLGEIDEERVEKAKEKLGQVRVKRFMTEIDSIGVFSENFVRIIWLHMTNCEKLQKEVEEVLDGLFEKEERFMGHLTIARVKSLKNKEEFLKSLRKINLSGIRFEVKNFRLKESVLAERPRYKTVEEYNLK